MAWLLISILRVPGSMLPVFPPTLDQIQRSARDQQMSIGGTCKGSMSITLDQRFLGFRARIFFTPQEP